MSTTHGSGMPSVGVPRSSHAPESVSARCLSAAGPAPAADPGVAEPALDPGPIGPEGPIERPASWRAPVIAGAIALAGCAYLATHDPNDPSVLMPQCPTKLLTGLDCPLCGGLRMVRALVTGHWSAALHDNAVLLALVPLVGYVWLRWLVAGLRGTAYQFSFSRRAGYAVLGLAVVWMVVRNLPGWPLKPGT